ncbi:molybdate ABC transporter substrate-binding protein [Leifsonia sp. NPDC058248]|uniref:molybdate ABC transporter substrate-binding protein n=1 Tax=Leifsonia sp. NPDC058248 TaxID=3346402 RepID=UPI0036DA2002
MTMRRILTAVALTATLALTVTGCSAGAASSGAGSSTPSTSTPSLHGTATVFAAASLTSTFTELGKKFEAAHPGTTVSFSFAGSSDLVSQITEGAPADVFASADEKNMTKVTDGMLAAGTPVDFATNVLAIAVPPGNPAHITAFADLAKPGVKTVICAPQVPCGAATAKVEASTGVTLTPVSEESAVTDVLGKVSSGEADAGIVYVTDVKGAGSSVDSVPFPEASSAVNTYPIVALKDAKDAALASAFVDYVTGPGGQKVLTSAGFGAP